MYVGNNIVQIVLLNENNAFHTKNVTSTIIFYFVKHCFENPFISLKLCSVSGQQFPVDEFFPEKQLTY